jgi:hypothetical protein
LKRAITKVVIETIKEIVKVLRLRALWVRLCQIRSLNSWNIRSGSCIRSINSVVVIYGFRELALIVMELGSDGGSRIRCVGTRILPSLYFAKSDTWS